jgi:hypothetical protein
MSARARRSGQQPPARSIYPSNERQIQRPADVQSSDYAGILQAKQRLTDQWIRKRSRNCNNLSWGGRVLCWKVKTMTAAKLDIHGKDTFKELSGLPLVRHIVQPRTLLRCPSCDSIRYTRRHRKCAVCEQALPEELLFTEAEAARIRTLLITEQQKHRDWLDRAG